MSNAKAEKKAEKIPIRFHPRVFASLGAELVTNDIVAVIELVKNSYDAFAGRVDVRIIEDEETAEQIIEIADDGVGMSRSVIEDAWCVVATPYKVENPFIKSTRRTRRVSGAKGLGRLSVARLGRDLEMFTKSANAPCWKVAVNWDSLAATQSSDLAAADVTEITKCPFSSSHGTLIRIKELNTDWTNERIIELKEQLSRLVSPFSGIEDFEIHLTESETETSDTLEINPPNFLSQPPYKFEGKIDKGGLLTGTYHYQSMNDDRGRTQKFKQTIWKSERNENYAKAKSETPQCGAFDFEIRAWDIDPNSIEELSRRFNSGKKSIRDDIRNYKGFSVYRDGILVLPKSDTGRDWLGLDLRRVSKVGTRLSTSQIVGYVSISAAENPGLVDTSDRERLADNQASRDFKELLIRAVAILEAERIKDKKDAPHKEPPFKDLFASLSAAPLIQKIEAAAQRGEDASSLLPLVEDFNTDVEKTVAQIERRLIYYSRLATIGVIAAMLLHEIRNHTTTLGRLMRAVRKLVEKGNPVGLSLEKDLIFAERGVRSLEKLAEKFGPLASRTYGTKRRNSVLEETIHQCLGMREDEIKAKNITIEIKPDWETEVAIDPGELTAVFLNLIDNAIYWLSFIRNKERRIEFNIQPIPQRQRVKVRVDDNGSGIAKGEEETVFHPGVTQKPDGLGMGLTIVSEVISQHNGNIALIQPGILGGASFAFDLPLAEE